MTSNETDIAGKQRHKRTDSRTDSRGTFRDQGTRRTFIERVHPAERKRIHASRAFYTMLHAVRNQVRQFREFTEELENELKNDWSDVTPHYMLFKQKQFIRRMHVFGHCPVSGDVIGESTFINHCGHVFNKASLEGAIPKIECCPTCLKKIVFKL